MADLVPVWTVKAAAESVAKSLSALDPHGHHLELEFRVGVMRGQRFDPGINVTLFENIKEALRTFPRWKAVTQSHTIDYTLRGTGERLTYDVDRRAWSSITKVKKGYVDVSTAAGCPFTIRVAMATEEVKVLGERAQPLDVVCKREKKRTSFEHKFWRYDITEVQQCRPSDKDDDKGVTYEVELELTDPSQIVGKPPDYVHYIVHYGILLCSDVIRLSKAM
jgi:hypothetical protein